MNLFNSHVSMADRNVAQYARIDFFFTWIITKHAKITSTSLLFPWFLFTETTPK